MCCCKSHGCYNTFQAQLSSVMPEEVFHSIFNGWVEAVGEPRCASHHRDLEVMGSNLLAGISRIRILLSRKDVSMVFPTRKYFVFIKQHHLVDYLFDMRGHQLSACHMTET